VTLSGELWLMDECLQLLMLVPVHPYVIQFTQCTGTSGVLTPADRRHGVPYFTACRVQTSLKCLE